MRFIAHRGLINGPDVNLENRPAVIEDALRQGFDCEIDVWYKDQQFFLGHDFPDYQVSFDFLLQKGLWLHAKNLDALYVLGADSKINYLWHQDDDYTLTSQGLIWTYPGKKTTSNSIVVMPERFDKNLEKEYNGVYGICSDYVAILREKYDTK